MQADHSANAFKSFEHDGWEQSVQQYDRSFGKLTRQLIPFLLEAIESPGRTLLDLACGPGYTTQAARERGWQVLGVDFSEQMVKKALSLYPKCKFAVGDAEALDFESRSFDAVLMSFGMLHLSNPEQAMEEVYRVLHDGGRFAFSVWAPPSEAQGFLLVQNAIDQAGNPSVSIPPGPPFFRFSAPNETEATLAKIGFRDFSAKKCKLFWKLDSGKELFDVFLHGTARSGALLRAQKPDKLKKIRKLLISEVESHHTHNGLITIPMSAWLYTSRK